MNNRGQNVNLNGTSQNHHPNQGYPQQNNQYQGNGYNGQNPQYNNQQYQGYNNNQNPQYRGQWYNAQSPQNNNMNNPQYRGQGNNGQNPQFSNPNNPQFSNQNGYNNPNQFNPQSGNNQNFNPMNRGPKMDSKMIGYITTAVAAILVVLMIFMFSSGSGKLDRRTPEEAVKNVISAMKDGDFGKLGGATPEETVKNYISAQNDGDFEKLLNNCYIESDEVRTEALEQLNNMDEVYKKEIVEKYSDMVEIGEVKSINENRAKVKVKGNTRSIYIYAEKVNGRWFVEGDLVSKD